MNVKALLLGSIFMSIPAYCLHPVSVSCLASLRGTSLQQSRDMNETREATSVAYYPDDYKLGEERDLMIYLHGFGSKPENYGTSGLGAAFEKERLQKGIQEPITLAIGLGPFVLAGSKDHGTHGAHFVNPELYWDVVLRFVASHDLKIRNVFMLGNSGGAFSGMQMLRHQPEDFRVKAAMFHVLPTIRGESLLPLAKNVLSRDPAGAALRNQFEAKLSLILKDEHFSELNMSLTQNLKGFPADTAVLIQDGEYDAFRYIDENIKLVTEAQLRGLTFFHHTLPQGGHSAPFDHDLALNFFKAMGNISN